MAEENTNSTDNSVNEESSVQEENSASLENEDSNLMKALRAEREARKEAERRRKEVEAKNREFEDAQLSEVERLKKQNEEMAAELSQTRLDAARNAALAKYPVPKEYQEFVIGTDAESFEIAAKKLHELNSKAVSSTPVTNYSVPGTGGEASNKGGDFEAAAAKARARYKNS